MSRARVTALVPLLCVSLACAGNVFDPKPVDSVGFLDRAQEQERDGVRVRVAVPSSKESKALFSTNLYKRGVQPIWIEIENSRDQPLFFMPVGLDPEYFTPIEAANVDSKPRDISADSPEDLYFFDKSMNAHIDPGTSRSGFIFTPVDEGTKAFNVDVIGDGEIFTFTFFVPVPGLRVDHASVDFEALYPAGEIQEMEVEALVPALQALPCCTRDKKAKDWGDPLNIVVVGSPEDIYYSFIRAGWDETETVYRGSLFKTIGSFLSGGQYRYSPVSALYVFGRPQDVAFQKSRTSINERNHLRLWMSPYRFEGQPVWIGQISRDIGVRFTSRTITTHKIDPDTDETREYLLEDLAYSQALAGISYVSGVGPATIEEPRGNLTGDPYFTDGYRVVLWVSASPVSIRQIRVMEWDQPLSEPSE